MKISSEYAQNKNKWTSRVELEELELELAIILPGDLQW